MKMTKFGPFEVELDPESNCLVVVNRDMKFILNIGGDALDVLDLDCNYLEGMELPV